MIQERVITPNHRELLPLDRFNQAASRMDHIITSAPTSQERLVLHRYSQNLLRIVAKPTKSLGETSILHALETQAQIPQELQERAWSITDTSREYYSGNPGVELIGIMHDLRRLTSESDSDKKRQYHEAYVLNYCRLRGMNNPEVTDYLTIISQAQRISR